MLRSLEMPPCLGLWRVFCSSDVFRERDWLSLAREAALMSPMVRTLAIPRKRPFAWNRRKMKTAKDTQTVV